MAIIAVPALLLFSSLLLVVAQMPRIGTAQIDSISLWAERWTWPVIGLLAMSYGILWGPIVGPAENNGHVLPPSPALRPQIAFRQTKNLFATLPIPQRKITTIVTTALASLICLFPTTAAYIGNWHEDHQLLDIICPTREVAHHGTSTDANRVPPSISSIPITPYWSRPMGMPNRHPCPSGVAFRRTFLFFFGSHANFTRLLPQCSRLRRTKNPKMC